MTMNDNDTLNEWLAEFGDKTPTQLTTEATKALNNLTQLMTLKRPLEEREQIVALIASGKCRLKYTVFWPASPIVIEAELRDLAGTMRYPLMTICAEHVSETTH